MSDYPSTRKEAQRLGHVHYYTGNPCKRGHDSIRQASNGHCTECDKNWHREYVRNRRQTDPEFRERCRKYAREYVRNRRQTDPEFRERCNKQQRERRKERYRNDLEFRERCLRLHKERQRERYNNNPEFRARYRRYHNARKRRHRRQTPPWADLNAIRSVYAEAQRLTDETGVPHEVDHVYPINGETVSGLHTAENLQVLSATENRSKSNGLPA